jgi:hypothetical protein
MESELRYIGEGWTFEPGDPKSRLTLKGHIFGALKRAVLAYEKYSLPQTKHADIWIRAPDLRPSDPNKKPPVFRKFYTNESLESLDLLLAHPQDLLVPVADAIRDVIRDTGHAMALTLPLADTNERIQQVRSYVGEGLDLVPVVESKRGVDNMLSMEGIVGYTLGVNDLTEDITCKGRGEEGYDQLDPRVLIYIKKAAENAMSRGLPIDVCSNIAEEQAGVVALLGLGFKDLTLPPVSADDARKSLNMVDSRKAAKEVERIISDSQGRLVTGLEVRQRLIELIS